MDDILEKVRVKEEFIRISEATPENLIGAGSFGIVLKANYCGTTVAVKSFHILQNPISYGIFEGTENYNKILNDFYKECEFLQKLKHPNILQFIGVALKNNKPWIVTEIAQCNLEDLIKNKKLKEENILMYIIQILQGLAAMHAHNIIHRDIKPANILIFNENFSVAKIADLGVAKIVENTQIYHNSLVGTASYCAPEILNRKYDFRVDVYSFALLICHLITTELYNFQIPDLISKASNFHLFSPFRDRFSAFLSSLFVDYRSRPTSSDCLHFFTCLQADLRAASPPASPFPKFNLSHSLDSLPSPSIRASAPLQHYSPPSLQHHSPSPSLQHHSPSPSPQHHSPSPSLQHHSPSPSLANGSYAPPFLHHSSPSVHNSAHSHSSSYYSPSPTSPSSTIHHTFANPIATNINNFSLSGASLQANASGFAPSLRPSASSSPPQSINTHTYPPFRLLSPQQSTNDSHRASQPKGYAAQMQPTSQTFLYSPHQAPASPSQAHFRHESMPGSTTSPSIPQGSQGSSQGVAGYSQTLLYSNNRIRDDPAVPNVKCVVVGDSVSDKTELIISYYKLVNQLKENFVVDKFDGVLLTTEINQHFVNVEIWNYQDTKGTLHPDFYPNVDIFILCFSVTSPASFDNLKKNWQPLVVQNFPKVPLMLVGTHSECRSTKAAFPTLFPTSNDLEVSFYQASHFARSLNTF